MVTIDAIKSRLGACQEKLNKNKELIGESSFNQIKKSIEMVETSLQKLEQTQKMAFSIDLKTALDKVNEHATALMDGVAKIESALQERIKDAEDDLKSEKENEALEKELATLNKKVSSGTASEADTKRMGEIFHMVMTKFNSLDEDDLETPIEKAWLPMMKAVLSDVEELAESKGVFSGDKPKASSKQ